jgi:hypothetical protein
MDDDVTERYFLGDDRLFIVERCAATGDLSFFTRIVMERWRSTMMKLSRHKRMSQFFFTRIVMERWRSTMMKLSRHKRMSQDKYGVSRHIQKIKNLIDATEEEIHSCATFTKLSLLNAIEILKSSK